MLSTAHRYFLVVARTGSIKDAAEQLHVAPSAISRQIAKLEQASRAGLFERKPQGMVLTRAGEVLAEYTRRVSMDAERVLHKIQNLGERDAAIIRIGANEAFARTILPEVMGEFNRHYPEVAFQVHVGSAGVVAHQLKDKSIDVGVSFSLQNSDKSKVCYEVDSPVRVVVAPSHPLATKRKLSLNELSPYPIALTESGTTVRLLFDSLQVEENRASFNLAYTSNSSTAIRSIVKLGYAVTLAGEITLMPDLKAGHLVAIPLSGTPFKTRTLRIETAENQPASLALARFTSALMDTLAAIYPSTDRKHRG